MRTTTDCFIVGAGPYGLSLGAHLRAKQVEFRIAGSPMSSWLTAMPAGMFLKSEGFASSLFEPNGRFTLGAYCAEHGVPYADTGIPVALETFIAYGQAFQKRFVPALEERMVASVQRADGVFRVAFADGDSVRARRVVIASGIQHYARTPAELGALPPPLLSHSSEHHDFTRFKGQRVIVVGAGASAMDVAAALRRAGAAATVVARRPTVRFQTPLGTRSFGDKIRAPMTVVGPGWKSVLCTKAPLLFHRMPPGFRTDVVRRYLGPAPAWFVREEVEGHVPILAGSTILGARVENGRGYVAVRRHGAPAEEIEADHVIAATGFQVDVDRLDFLDPSLRAAIRRNDGAPCLSSNFEASVRGLYFIGPASANSFGPMLRFAAGAGFTARRLSRHLAKQSARPAVATESPNLADAVPAEG
jgi:thioredoxin reductase